MHKQPRQHRIWARSLAKKSGFTIIEVMIVLAIGAIILLIVLLAVPALQRNARNTGRNQDAGQLAAAVNNCLANNNNDPLRCESIGSGAVDYDGSRSNEYPVPLYDTLANNSGGGSILYVGHMYWSFGGTATVTGLACNGLNNGPASSTRQFTVRYGFEASNGAVTARCISS